MTQSRSKYEFQQEASLSQQLAHRQPDYIDLAGADPKTSKTIQTIKDLIRLGILDGNDEGIKIMLTLLNGRRKALFATSEKVNEITKMGLQMPKADVEADMGDIDEV